jgi:hypothetical protein
VPETLNVAANVSLMWPLPCGTASRNAPKIWNFSTNEEVKPGVIGDTLATPGDALQH